MPGRSETITAVSIAGVITVADQLTKAAVVSVLGPGQQTTRIEFVKGWVALEYAENRGMAFGLFPGLDQFLVIATLAVTIGLIVHFFIEDGMHIWQTVAIGAISGGAIGNLVDRIKLGYVIDFVSVGWWPNFNVADSAITLGVLILAWGWLRSNRNAINPEMR